MQFIKDGPEIPDALLQEHEDGKVIFFCGAGISYPAGLPGFGGLVSGIYDDIGETPDDIEQENFDSCQFDATLELLERRLPNGRLKVRTALFHLLEPKLRKKGAKDTHKALLQLGRDSKGVLRLITTNFDRIFEKVSYREKTKLKSYNAPMFPVPKNSRWDGLIYLHGLLPKLVDERELNRLVLTSGDFGLAYLTERWAARFVSELFRNYTVCFVGYSINDPVMRYMMDALAADKRLGEVTPQAYAFGDCEPGNEKVKTVEWEAKGVTPILYKKPANTHHHSKLHGTLKVWGETHRDGILGKERIVVDYAMAKPIASTKQDDFVGRMLWALSDKSGLPAKRFAEHNPAPSLDWLFAFCQDKYGHADLRRFDVSPNEENDDRLKFCLIRRPSPYTKSPWMEIVSNPSAVVKWDEVMFQLARWLVRHLDDPSLILWVASSGSQLHEELIRLIENELIRFFKLEESCSSEELQRIRSQSPNAVPKPILRPLWNALLANQVKVSWQHLNHLNWKARFKREGLTASLRVEFRKLLAPTLVLKEPFRWPSEDEDNGKTERLKDLVDWELVLAVDHVRSFLEDLSRNDTWLQSLPLLMNDLQQLLEDALEIIRDLGEASDYRDHSVWDIPSISEHEQNRGFREWTALIELLRDSWLAVLEINQDYAAEYAKRWFSVPFPTFKRLALFAASQTDCIKPSIWVGWLIEGKSRWLWSSETKRESLRLLVLQGAVLKGRTKLKLEEAILKGPPESYRKNLDDDEWQRYKDKSIWLRLEKLFSSGITLGENASAVLMRLKMEYPELSLAEDKSDEFSVWFGGFRGGGFGDVRRYDVTPKDIGELENWLMKPSEEHDFFYDDNWQETCKTDLELCANALIHLAEGGNWPAERWREAMQVWSNKEFAQNTWIKLGGIVAVMPEEVLVESLHTITWWLEAVSKELEANEDTFINLCRRVLELAYNDEETDSSDDPVLQAINHPVGHITKSLLNMLYARKPNDSDLLPVDLAPLFTQLCDTNIELYKHGRVVLSSRLIFLFRVDRNWTESNLLPLLDWNSNRAEARSAWEGFLWSPRIYPPLLIAFKDQFLTCTQYYDELGKHSRQFAAFITYAALSPIESYSDNDYRSAFENLPLQALEEASNALQQALEGAGEQIEDYWENRIKPFWYNIWPKSRQYVSKNTSENFAQLIISSRSKFQDALHVLRDWIVPIEYPDYVVHRLYESGLASQFPLEALDLLNIIVGDTPWMPHELEKCLISIIESKTELEEDPRYIRLYDYIRRRSS